MVAIHWFIPSYAPDFDNIVKDVYNQNSQNIWYVCTKCMCTPVVSIITANYPSVNNKHVM